MSMEAAALSHPFLHSGATCADPIADGLREAGTAQIDHLNRDAAGAIDAHDTRAKDRAKEGELAAQGETAEGGSARGRVALKTGAVDRNRLVLDLIAGGAGRA